MRPKDAPNPKNVKVVCHGLASQHIWQRAGPGAAELSSGAPQGPVDLLLGRYLPLGRHPVPISGTHFCHQNQPIQSPPAKASQSGGGERNFRYVNKCLVSAEQETEQISPPAPGSNRTMSDAPHRGQLEIFISATVFACLRRLSTRRCVGEKDISSTKNRNIRTTDPFSKPVDIRWSVHHLEHLLERSRNTKPSSFAKWANENT